jgi:Spy/CpxP family protein refolding chaperone
MNRTRAFSLACSLLFAAPFAFSQNPGGPPQPFGPPDGGMQSRGLGEGHSLGIVPHGAWWKNPNMVTLLGLSADQQKRLDDILLQSRIQLIHMKATLEEEQVKLEPMLNANTLDQANAYAQISKIADLRAELEKANAKMLLSLRAVLTADQWTKLQTQRHMMHREGTPNGFPGRHNPDAPIAPGAMARPGGAGGPSGAEAPANLWPSF